MKAFAALLDHLVYQPSRLGKLRLLMDYFNSTPDPDRGFGLAALAGTLDIPHAKPALLRQLIAAQIEQPLLGIVGEPRVNLLALNRALDQVPVKP